MQSLPPRQRVLIAEDQLTVGMQIAAIVEDCGFVAVGPVTTVLTALPLALHEPIAAALLDIYLIDQTVEPIAAVLKRRGILFGFVTAYSRHHLPPDLQTRPCVNKPFVDHDIRAMLMTLTGTPAVQRNAPV